mgnify:CR=1 FL=1
MKHHELKQLNLDRSTGYPQLDFELIELIKNIPGQWEPAENANGEKVQHDEIYNNPIDAEKAIKEGMF